MGPFQSQTGGFCCRRAEISQLFPQVSSSKSEMKLMEQQGTGTNWSHLPDYRDFSHQPLQCAARLCAGLPGLYVGGSCEVCRHSTGLARCPPSLLPTTQAFFLSWEVLLSVLSRTVQEFLFLGWRDGSVVKSTSCFCREPGFSSQHPQGSSQPSGRQFRGIWCPLLAPTGATCTWCTDIQTQGKHSYTWIKDKSVSQKATFPQLLWISEEGESPF